jgi:3-oxo-5-alpha-steroid 4-dehydrogenase 1
MLSFTISWQAFQLFSWIWIGLAIIVFFILLFVTAPYGRHTSVKWGPMISNRAGWVMMEVPVLVVLLLLVVPYMHLFSALIWTMLGMFCFHYFNRVFIFPFRLHTKGKKMPVAIVLSAIFFNIVNGFSIGYYFTHFADYSSTWSKDPRFISGTILFFTGIYINWKADTMLIRLRKPGETGYKIPQNWMFEYISCPNLFGELIEWLGFAILCWNLPALCFFIWTAANLIPRALSHHKWYHEKFRDYPGNRKAILPFIA